MAVLFEEVVQVQNDVVADNVLRTLVQVHVEVQTEVLLQLHV